MISSSNNCSSCDYSPSPPSVLDRLPALPACLLSCTVTKKNRGGKKKKRRITFLQGQRTGVVCFHVHRSCVFACVCVCVFCFHSQAPGQLHTRPHRTQSQESH